MASSIGAGRTRTVGWVVFAVTLVALAIDAGSVGLTRMSVTDNTKAAARAAAQAVDGLPVNQETAVVAYEAASQAIHDGEEILQNPAGENQDFRVSADGSITLTVERVAPSLTWRHLPVLKDFVRVQHTYHQPKIGY